MSVLRLYSGLFIFAYCLFHLTNHAIGILLVDSMEEARKLIMWIWHRDLFKWALYVALVVHPAVSLVAIFQRRHLRMPTRELVQLLSGILIPVLIAQHIASALLAEQVLGANSTYHRILLEYWVEQPWRVLQMSILLIFVWAHACLGLHYWLRYRRWYTNRIHHLVAAAVAIPALALAGFVASGISLARDVADDASLARQIRDQSNSAGPEFSEFVAGWEFYLLASYVFIIGAVFAARWLRDVLTKQENPVRVRYLDGGEVVAPHGLSVMEVSRLAAVPHQSKCGGRGRCSTCRVRILAQSEDLPPPGTLERDTLDRIGAASDIRLACQLRPRGTIVVQALMPIEAPKRQQPELTGLETGQEMEVVIMAVDLRGSTELCAQKLPYDALFIVEQYLSIVVAAVRNNDGHIVSIAGDGVMALFGLTGELQKSCRDALRATDAVWCGIDRLNDELAAELPWPLRFGIGVHAGECVVGITTADARTSVQFLGNPGNIASRLESTTKQLKCAAVISEHAVSVAGLDRSLGRRHSVDLDGWPEPMLVVAIESHDALTEALNNPSEADQLT